MLVIVSLTSLGCSPITVQVLFVSTEQQGGEEVWTIISMSLPLRPLSYEVPICLNVGITGRYHGVANRSADCGAPHQFHASKSVSVVWSHRVINVSL